MNRTKDPLYAYIDSPGITYWTNGLLLVSYRGVYPLWGFYAMAKYQGLP